MKEDFVRASVLLGKQSEVSKKLWHFLQAVPHLEITEGGYYSLAERFGLSVEGLKALTNQVRQGGRLKV